jgi:hypothetical protein
MATNFAKPGATAAKEEGGFFDGVFDTNVPEYPD